MRKKKELECIHKLIYEDMYYEFQEYLIDNKIAKAEEFVNLANDAEKARFICATLEQAAKDEKLILLDYEWAFLPIEIIKVTCVTETEKKEFTYGY